MSIDISNFESVHFVHTVIIKHDKTDLQAILVETVRQIIKNSLCSIDVNIDSLK